MSVSADTKILTLPNELWSLGTEFLMHWNFVKFQFLIHMCEAMYTQAEINSFVNDASSQCCTDESTNAETIAKCSVVLRLVTRIFTHAHIHWDTIFVAAKFLLRDDIAKWSNTRGSFVVDTLHSRSRWKCVHHHELLQIASGTLDDVCSSNFCSLVALFRAFVEDLCTMVND